MTTPDSKTEHRRQRALGSKARAGIGLLVICFGLLVSRAWSQFRDLPLRAKHAEVTAALQGIRAAELAHLAEHGRLLAAAPTPVSVDALRSGTSVWPTGSAFDSLGWTPEGPVRGTYEVRLLDGGAGFVVHGWIDGDGDGVPAHYTATRDTEALRLTAASVF